MVVTKEAGTYSVLLISGYAGGSQIGFVYFYEKLEVLLTLLATQERLEI